MAETFILAEVCANEFERDRVASYPATVRPLLERVDGFRSLSLWRATDDESRFLLLSHYAGAEAAAGGLKAVGEGHLLTDYVDSLTAPPDVRQVVVDARDGASPGKVPSGGYLSMSTQAPSNEEAARQDLEDVLAGLLYLTGCLGTAHGANAARPGELIGLAFWANHETFMASVPEISPYPVRGFRKLSV